MVQEKNKKFCPAVGKCGGCSMLATPYREQLARKQKTVEKLLQPYGKVEPILGMKQPEHYRHKVHAVYAYDKRRGVYHGNYEEKTHRVVRVESCLLENEKADAIFCTIDELAKSFKIRAYDEDTGYGLLRHVLIRVGHATGQILVVLVLSSPILPSKNNFIKALRKRHPEITSIVLNVNDKATSMVLGEKEHILYGKGYIEDAICGYTFRISPKSFYQVNPAQTEVLYRKAMEYAALTGKETVLDAYCGTGTIGIVASEKAGKVIGVELNKDAVRDAVMNAKTNGVKNIQFYQKDAGQFAVQLAESGEKVDVVLMDPPRSGSDETFLSCIARLSPNRIVYISCNPETLARDLAYLKKLGYRMNKATPVDLFPFTNHVETVVLLSKGMVDSRKVKVDFSLEDMDLSEFKGKATYEQIKAYVLEQTELKVSSLYIAQIKKKCGLDVGENFNLPKSENARQPQCTQEKEDAIMQAFRHFGII